MKTKLTWFDRIMAAVTFAEADEAAEANRFLTQTECKSEKKQKCRECDVIITSDLHGVEAQ